MKRTNLRISPSIFLHSNHTLIDALYLSITLRLAYLFIYHTYNVFLFKYHTYPRAHTHSVSHLKNTRRRPAWQFCRQCGVIGGSTAVGSLGSSAAVVAAQTINNQQKSVCNSNRKGNDESNDNDDGNEDNGGNLPLPTPLPQPC